MKMKIFKYLFLFLGIIFLDSALLLDQMMEQNIRLFELNEPCEHEEKEEISEQEIDEFIHFTMSHDSFASHLKCISNIYHKTNSNYALRPELPPPERMKALI